MPVGTQGAVKALTHRQLIDAGAQIILGNTYHLHLRPGEGSSRGAGAASLHRLGQGDPHRQRGYQVFSLAARRKISEAGAHFKSHLDGSARFLSLKAP